MKSGWQDERAGQKPGFQFTEGHMERLRRGDAEAAEEVAKEVVRQCDSWLRAIRAQVGWKLCREDCEDIVSDFYATKMEGLMRYKNVSAKHFTALFYKSLKNHAVDWVRKYGREIPESQIGNGGREEEEGGYLERLPAAGEDFRERLSGEEVASLEAAVQGLIREWASDPVQAWVLEASMFGGLTAEAVSAGGGEKFPGKGYAPGSVYSLLSRFRAESGLRRLRNEYF